MTNLQSPEVLQKDEAAFGVAIYPHKTKQRLERFNLEYVAGGTHLFSRVGLGNNFDCGVKVFGFPFLLRGGVATDVKYQFLNEPVAMSSYLELSYSTHKAEEVIFGYFLDAPLKEEQSRSMWGVHPALLFGKKYLYGGVKVFNLFSAGRGYHNLNGGFLGCALEKSWFRASLEVSKYFPAKQGVPVLWAFGLEFKISQ